MSLKKIMPVFAVWITTLVFGFWYNESVMNWYPVNGERYLVNVLFVVCVCALWLGMAKLGGLNEKETKVTSVKFIAWCAITTVVLTLFRHSQIFGTSSMILTILFYPAMALCIRECTVGKHGRLGLTAAFVAVLAAMYLLNGLKMMAFTGLVFLLAQAIAIGTVATEKKKRRWIHWGMMLAGFAIFMTVAVLGDHGLRERVFGMAQPENVEQYRTLLDWFDKCKMFDFNIGNTFVKDMRSPYAATYAHIMVCFGVVPGIIFIMIKTVTVAYMWHLADKFTDPSRKYIAMSSTGTISLHLLMSVLSSFMRIPLTEFGAPFVTVMGIAYGLVAIVAYTVVFFKERKDAEVKE